MRINTILIVAILAILTSMLVQACSGTDISLRASSTSQTSFSGETSKEIVELEMEPEMNSNILRIKEMKVESGQIVFKLSSPDGRVEWEESFTAPADYQNTFDLDVTPGTWRLEIEMENATGNYDLDWMGSN